MQLGKENCERRVELNFRKLEIVPLGKQRKDLNIHSPCITILIILSRPALSSSKEEHINLRLHTMTKSLV